MKIPALSLIAAVLLAGTPAQAQTPSPMRTPDAAMRRAFEQTRSRMDIVHRTERSQMLAALTPSQRSLLASIAGQLATSVTPDYDAAAKRLDSALSASEAQSILSAARNAEAQERTILESMPPPPPPPPGTKDLRFHTQHFGEGRVIHIEGPGGEQPPDAGRTLLRVMMSGPMGMEMGFRTGVAPPKP